MDAGPRGLFAALAPRACILGRFPVSSSFLASGSPSTGNIGCRSRACLTFVQKQVRALGRGPEVQHLQSQSCERRGRCDRSSKCLACFVDLSPFHPKVHAGIGVQVRLAEDGCGRSSFPRACFRLEQRKSSRLEPVGAARSSFGSVDSSALRRPRTLPTAASLL